MSRKRKAAKKHRDRQERRKKKVYNKHNFHTSTQGVWKHVCQLPEGLEFDKPEDPSTLRSGKSRYWITKSGVYRWSDHWSNTENPPHWCTISKGTYIGTCLWFLENPKCKVPKEWLFGFIEWDEFKDCIAVDIVRNIKIAKEWLKAYEARRAVS